MNIVRTMLQVVEIVGVLVSRGPAGPFGGLLQRQPPARPLESCDRYFRQITVGCWMTTRAVPSATGASLDWC
jgi:hypothetical protein